MAKSYGFNNFFCVEDLQRLDINELVQEITPQFKIQLIKSKLQANGLDIELETSKTAFGGERLWFTCTKCKKRKGVLFLDPLDNSVGCRECLRLLYKCQ